MLRLNLCRALCLISLFFVFVSCAVHDDDEVITAFTYPNPCTAATGAKIAVKYQSTAAGALSLFVYVNDSTGNAVVVQRRSVTVTAGANTIEIPWDVTNDRGDYLAPGPYILKVTTEGLTNSLESHTAWNRILVK